MILRPSCSAMPARKNECLKGTGKRCYRRCCRPSQSNDVQRKQNKTGESGKSGKSGAKVPWNVLKETAPWKAIVKARKGRSGWSAAVAAAIEFRN